jgi:hypothetical protein
MVSREELKLNNILLLGLISSFTYAQNINYASNDIHTLTVPKNKLYVTLSKQLMNDTVDILNIKESEFGNSTKFDAIGDLDGNALKVRYGILDNLMININYVKQDISYSSKTLKNTKTDIFLRYNLFQNKSAFLNSGLSVDVGYVKNKLDNFYLDNLEEMNDLANKISKKLAFQSFEIKESPVNIGEYNLFDSNGAPMLSNDLVQKPWIALKDTEDKSSYLRILTGFYINKSVFDFYIGIKKTKIKNYIITTDELMAEIQKVTTLPSFNIQLNRNETMYMAGFNYTLEASKTIYEFGFEYDRFSRDEGLDYIDYNYIFDLSITKYLNENIAFNVGSRIMYRQLNGQIPYLYNEYSQTSYDHKYGYAFMGISFNY